MLLTGLIFEIFQRSTSYKGNPTYASSNIFTLIEALFLFEFYKKVIDTKVAGKIITILTLIFVAIWITYFIKSGYIQYLDIVYGLECICIIGLSIFYFFKQISKPDSLYIYAQPRFWIVTAYLIYTAGTLFLFLFQEDLSIEEQKKYFILNSVFLILKTLILSIAMLLKTKITERKKFELT